MFSDYFKETLKSIFLHFQIQQFQGESSNRTFICSTKENHWIEGPSLLSERYCHSSCAIHSDDGSISCIIIIGGCTPKEGFYSKSTEILNIKDNKWIQGPKLPCAIAKAACVSLPPTANFACVLLEGWTFDNHSSNVYGLNKTLTEWTHLGKIRIKEQCLIALPLS